MEFTERQNIEKERAKIERQRAKLYKDYAELERKQDTTNFEKIYDWCSQQMERVQDKINLLSERDEELYNKLK